MLETNKVVDVLESNYCKALEYEGKRKIEEEAEKNKKLNYRYYLRGIIISFASLIRWCG